MTRTLHSGLALAVGLAAGVASGAEPASGTLTETSGPLEYTAGPFLVPNPTPDLSLAGQEAVCEPALMNCDIYTFTVTLPEGYAEAHPDDTILIEVSWPQITPEPADVPDYDVYVYDDSGKLVSDAGATSTNPERIRLPVSDGTRTYEIRTLSYQPAGESIQGRVVLDKLEAQSSSSGVLAAGGFGGGLLVLAAAAGLARRRR